MLRISSDGDDRNFMGGDIFYSRIFMGRKILQLFFLEGLI